MIAPPRLRLVAVLLAGRGAFRGTIVLSAPVLLALWGDQEFAPYAVALGATLVLSPLVGSGAEKSAGLLLGRAAGAEEAAGRARLLGAQLIVGATIAAASLIATVTLVPWSADSADLFVLAACTNVGFGAVQALVAYWRVIGRPYLDAISHGALAGATAVGVALAALVDAGPRAMLTLQAVSAMLIAVALGGGLRHRIAKPRRPDLARTARTTLLMGANTLLATAAVSVVFAIMAQRGMVTAAGHLYLAIVGYAVLANLLDYLLRVYQPWLAASVSGPKPALLRAIRRASGLGLTALMPLSAGAVVLISRSLSGPVEAMLAVAAVAPALLAVAALVWLLENLDAGTLIGTVLAGTLGLIGTAAVASALPESAPVTGAALALLAGATLTTTCLLPMLGHRVADSQRKLPLVPIQGRQS